MRKLSSERLLDYNPVTGAKEWFSRDDDGNCFIRYEEDVQEVLDYNKESLANDDLDRRSEMWHAAKIPNSIIMKWKVDHGIELWNPDHKDGVRKLLNSDEWRYLRVNHFII